MSAVVLLGAADWSRLIAFLVVAGISVAAHLIKLANRAKTRKPDAMSPPPNRPARPNPDLSEEVEAFLKGVQQKQGNRAQSQGPRRPPRRQAQGARPAGNQPVVAEVVDAQIVPATLTSSSSFGQSASLSGDAVGVEAENLGRQSQSLGDQIDQGDQRIAEQIHSKFDHQLGQFESGRNASDDVTQAASQADADMSDMGGELRQMLADPRDVRRAIVLNEILNPPVDRW